MSTSQSIGRWIPVGSLFLTLMLLSLSEASGQSILKRVKNKVEQTVGDKIIDKSEKAVARGVDKVMGAEAEEANPLGNPVSETEGESASGAPSMLKAYSNYDFIPGDSVIYAADFSSEALSELPAGWNTNGNSSIVQLESLQGQWLRIAQKTVNLTDNRKGFGTDFTVEFDAFMQFAFEGWYPPSLRFGLLASGAEDPSANRLLSDPRGDKTFYMELSPMANGANILLESYNKNTRHFHSPVSSAPAARNWYGKVVHVAMQAQKERLRIWIDGEKMYDIPKALPSEGLYNQLFFQLGSSSYADEQVGVYISNISIAKGLADARHRLVEDGRFSTSGILFDVGSAVIKPESSGVLNTIGNVLKQNPDMKVRIVGHTDGSGDEKANQLLSEQRAEAVKGFLSSRFSLDNGRLESTGKGESEPVADNRTREGMAQNRRVDFIRL